MMLTVDHTVWQVANRTTYVASSRSDLGSATKLGGPPSVDVLNLPESDFATFDLSLELFLVEIATYLKT